MFIAQCSRISILHTEKQISRIDINNISAVAERKIFNSLGAKEYLRNSSPTFTTKRAGTRLCFTKFIEIKKS